jgi:hypothetical protein
MLKLVRELGPLAVAVAFIGAVIAYLLASGNNIGNWLLAAFLIGHGWVHFMYVMPQPKTATATAAGPDWPFSLDRSWLGGGSALHGLGTVLVVVTAAGYMLAALASIPLIVSPDMWAALVIFSSLVSALLIGLFFSPSLLLGLAIDAALIAAVVLASWRPA